MALLHAQSGSYRAKIPLSRHRTITSARVDRDGPPAIVRRASRPRPFPARTVANAPVAELVDALDSKSSSARSAGSIPARGTSLRCFAATAWRARCNSIHAKQRRLSRRSLGEGGRPGHNFAWRSHAGTARAKRVRRSASATRAKTDWHNPPSLVQDRRNILGRVRARQRAEIGVDVGVILVRQRGGGWAAAQNRRATGNNAFTHRGARCRSRERNLPSHDARDGRRPRLTAFGNFSAARRNLPVIFWP